MGLCHGANDGNRRRSSRKCGRPIAEWKDLIRSSPLTKHMEFVSWLTSAHRPGYGHANALVAHTLGENGGQ
ncbi:MULTISPECIES: DUF4287 domain-containing protein [Streptomyces]|uniref:DUF4287 domain-containing protein n=1 Tax=Streptomyces TaxID=1883 RepID=UPI0036B10AF0